jgi:hypothetical protein
LRLGRLDADLLEQLCVEPVLRFRSIAALTVAMVLALVTGGWHAQNMDVMGVGSAA